MDLGGVVFSRREEIGGLEVASPAVAGQVDSRADQT
jgi:hypothetical protein